jgi:hypothetical protein
MFKPSGILFLLMAVWCAVLLFWTSQSVQDADRALHDLQKAKDSEYEAVRVLMSEWEYLNRPDRLEYLAQQYLPLKGHAEKNRILTSGDQLYVAPIPAVPKAKPQNLLQYVATQKMEEAIAPVSASPVPRAPENVIDAPEREKFSDLISTLSAEGQE